jgi:two-component system, NtrC family, sensor histidine kinase HupT/HoxJ
MTRTDNDIRYGREGGLIDQAGVADTIAVNPATESAWIEVIEKMDEVYADLVRYQLELEEKNAELEEAQGFISGVLASMTDVLIACDSEGRVQQTNYAAEKLTGKREHELLGKPLASLFVNKSAPLVEKILQQVREEQIIVDREVSLIDREDNPAPLSINCSSRHDHNGRLVGMVLIGRPIGELRRAYKELDKAHKELGQAQQQLVFSEKMSALGRLVAGVAHELNNPISFVFGNMYALRRYGERITAYLTAVDSGTDKETLARLRKEQKIDRVIKDIAPLVEGTLEGAERISEIVQDLRRFSSGQEEPLEPFDLARVVRTATRWVVKSAKNKPEVVFDVPDELETVGRKGAVHQIIVNFVQNAVDVTTDLQEARVEISCGAHNDQAWVRVRDNGPGIAPGDMHRIFEPFFTTKRLGEGTGLGLYVSYGLAEEQGGHLQCANHSEGGAVFTLKLPVSHNHEI